jgi:O-antigen ligase
MTERVRADAAARFLFAAVAAAPVIYALSTWNHDPQASPAQMMVRHFHLPVLLIEMAVVLVWLGSGGKRDRVTGHVPKWSKIAMLALSLIVVGHALVLMSVSPGGTMRSITWLLHAVFGVAVWDSISRAGTRGMEQACRWIAFGILAYCAILFAFVVTVPDQGRFKWFFLGLGVTTVRQLGAYSAVGFGAAIALAALATSNARWIGCVAIAALALGISFWSGTRASLVSAGAAIILAVAMIRVMRSRRALGAVAFAAIGGVALTLLTPPPDPAFGLTRMAKSMEKEDINEIGSDRFKIWRLAALQIAERPLFGFGEATINAPSPHAVGKIVQPHNAILQMLLQWGVIGAACFFSLIGALWLRMSKALMRDPEAHLGMFLIATSLLVQSLFEGMLFFPYPVMMTVFALAASAALTPPAPAAGTSHSPAPRSADREATGSG